MFSASLLLTALLALAVSANPTITIHNAPITLQLSRSLNATKIGNLYQNDLNRARALKAHGTDNVANEFFGTTAVNQGASYVTTVGIGSPPTLYNLIVDTGSGYTWVGASKGYVKTRSSAVTAWNVSVGYGPNGHKGTLYTDTVTLGPGIVVQKQPIGVVWTAEGPRGVDGVLGLGPANSTIDRVTSGPKVQIPTITDSLFAAHVIRANSIAISFQPATKLGVVSGRLSWGAVESSKFSGKITYVPVTSTSPASKYWGITQTVDYGNLLVRPILSITSGVVDTGTTFLLIASDAFDRYQAQTGATLDPVTKLLTISPAGFKKMKSLRFKIGPFEFTANAQIWPRTLNAAIGGTPGKIYLVVADIGHKSGQGFDFINGQVWLQRFDSVYDATNKRVGFANSRFTYAKTN